MHFLKMLPARTHKNLVVVKFKNEQNICPTILETALSLEDKKRKEKKANRPKTPIPIHKNYSSINCLHLFFNY